MTMVGMDIASVRALAGAFDAKADQLDAVRGAIDGALGSAGWEGPDAVDFQTLWASSYQRILVNCASELREAGKTARRNADEQERASDDSGAGRSQPGQAKPHSRNEDRGLPGSLDDWLADRVQDGIDWVGDRVQDGIDRVQDGIDRVQDGIDWVGDRVQDGIDVVMAVTRGTINRVDAIWEGLKTYAEAQSSFISQFTRIVTEGRFPQPAELLASSLLIIATISGLSANIVTGEDQHFFDDGDPWTGTPSTDLKGGSNIVPENLQDVMAIGHDTYNSDGVRVVAVTGDDGQTRFIVAVPGTEPEISDPAGWTGNPNGRDWPANAWAMANGSNSGTEAAMTAVDRAIEQYQADHPEAVIGDRPELLMTGHSQGGITTANMAADSEFASRYDIQGIITNGSPVDCAEIPSDVPVLALQHGGETWITAEPVANPYPTGPGVGNDVVVHVDPSEFGDGIPRLDLGGWPGSPENVTHGYLPAPSPMIDAIGNHDQENYANSVAPGTPGGQIMNTWQTDHPEVDNFLTGDKGDVTHYNVPFGRTTD